MGTLGGHRKTQWSPMSSRATTPPGSVGLLWAKFAHKPPLSLPLDKCLQASDLRKCGSGGRI